MTESSESNQIELTELTADLVSAYVSNNPVPPSELPALIAQVHESLKNLGAATAQPEPEKPTPAVSVRRSVTDDHLVCLEIVKGNGCSCDERRPVCRVPGRQRKSGGYVVARFHGSAFRQDNPAARPPEIR